MFANERYGEILQMLEKTGSVTVSELAHKFRVSIETVRRDLFYLEKKNLLQRVHGGAIVASKMSRYKTLEKRLDENVDKKLQCAQAAMALIEENDVIFVDSGSTAVEFARVLKSHFNALTVITHSLDVYIQLREARDFRLILIGGEYAPEEAANHGFLAEDMVRRLHAVQAFIFPYAISLKHGMGDQETRFIPIQRAYMENADRTVFVSDSSKFEKNCFLKLCDLEPQHIFITDADISEDIYKAYTEKNIKLYRGGKDRICTAR